VIEDLNVKGMVKNRKLSRAISDVGFGMLRQFIEYKAKFRNCVVVIANRFFPSSKTCSSCGRVKQNLTLKDRVYACDCGLVIDRDLNAALVLNKYSPDTI
jgi:putative transposase